MKNLLLLLAVSLAAPVFAQTNAEIAITDPNLRVAVCAAIKKPDPEVCR